MFPGPVLHSPSPRRPGVGRRASVRCVTTVSTIPARSAAVPAGPTPAPASRSEPRTSSVPPVTTTASARPLPLRPSPTQPGASLSTPRSSSRRLRQKTIRRLAIMIGRPGLRRGARSLVLLVTREERRGLTGGGTAGREIRKVRPDCDWDLTNTKSCHHYPPHHTVTGILEFL